MATSTKKIRIAILMIAFIGCFTSWSQVYTFTPALAIGNIGPTQGMVDLEYTGTSLDGAVTVIGGIQYWIIPASGNYSIETFGGQGYGPFGGRGAHMYGEFTLTAGDTLKILVGQKAGDYLNFPSTTYNHQFGGGGGSFVTQTNNTPYVVSGGGGGNHGVAFTVECDAQITTSGAAGTNGSILGAGGINGLGGGVASSADGGGGLLGNGGGVTGGIAFVNGGLGGFQQGTGGFGCGGGTSSWNNYRGGGGGGYSGGGAANNSSLCCPSGGGGGSFNAGINQTNLAGVQLGDGMVIISNLCSPTVMTLDLPVLPDYNSECYADLSMAPTASNDCGVTIYGTPDVAFPITTQGTTPVVWTFDDGVSLLTQGQNIVLTDVTAPVPDAAALLDSTFECFADTLFEPTATDNCSGLVTVTNDAVFPITTNGTTIVTWTFDDGNGNTSTQTQNVVVNTADAGIAQSGSQLYATGLGSFYQWLDCDNSYSAIAGAVNQFFTPASTGNYAVEVTFGNCVDTSVCILVDLASIGELSKDQFSIYPNPSNDGIFSVDFEGEIKQIEVTDALGRLITLPTDVIQGKVDGASLANGKYIVRIITENEVFMKEIMIAK